ncbi:hypothetical protein [Burkholderia sp. AU15512]|uniref:hypothetical protein n=1 Tax=Burkholderia sp. AU15512 TaxID=2015345 RepID=UPI000B7A5BC0|nr:hypothetical protein [Burkholderia sp. AU15512]OXI17420.1 hypothetical protein CFB43_22330 [Burkholderia sp. AU15512]
MELNVVYVVRFFLLIFSLSLFFLASQAIAVGVPVAIQAEIEVRVGDVNKLRLPIIDVGPVMEGAYIYFVENKSHGPGYVEDGRPYVLDAHISFYDAKYVWHDVLFDRYVKDDGAPEISAVFFANVGRDKSSAEVVVLVRTPLNHYDYGGDYYDGYVYKLTGDPRTGVVFVGLQRDASAPFLDQCECSFRDGRSTRARYKNTESIRKALQEKYPTSPSRRK